jgi:hypothetical protein
MAGDPAGGPAFVGSSGSRVAPHSGSAVGVVGCVVVVVDPPPLLGTTLAGGLAEPLPPEPHAAASTPTSATPRSRATTRASRGEDALIA